MLVTGLFGIGCAVTLWLAVLSCDPDALTLAGALTIMWALLNVAWLLNAMWAFPPVDLAAGLVALRMWVRRDADWIYVFVGASLVRLELHVLDWLTGHAFLVPYIHALNATFACMLVVVAASGRGHGFDRLRRRVRNRLRSLWPTHRQAAAP